jgi:ribose/xylose/arabinose/galactoside ABC-type transport system permease subunit
MKALKNALNLQKSGLLLVTLLLGVLLSLLAGAHTDRLTGREVNNFLNSYTLMQSATDASFFAIMAVGVTMIIIAGGIDLSVGSIYALSGVLTALTLRSMTAGPALTLWTGMALCLGLGLACGLANGLMVVGLRVHPFIITLGTMWVFRGIAFVASKAESILLPECVVRAVKLAPGADGALYPVPLLVMLAVTALGALFLSGTVSGRHVYAIGGNLEASRYAGLRTGRVLVSVYALSGLAAGIAAFVGSGYYGSASCADATGYELYVIASAVVGGASLSGGKGSAVNATLGAILIVLIRQSIRTLHFDQNYEWIIIGSAIVVAVVLDRLNARLAARRMAGGG